MNRRETFFFLAYFQETRMETVNETESYQT